MKYQLFISLLFLLMYPFLSYGQKSEGKFVSNRVTMINSDEVSTIIDVLSYVVIAKDFITIKTDGVGTIYIHRLTNSSKIKVHRIGKGYFFYGDVTILKNDCDPTGSDALCKIIIFKWSNGDNTVQLNLDGLTIIYYLNGKSMDTDK